MGAQDADADQIDVNGAGSSAAAQPGTALKTEAEAGKAEPDASEGPAGSLGDYIELPPPLAEAHSDAAAAPGMKRALDTEPEVDIDRVGKSPYWMQWCKRIQSPLLRLHQGAERKVT